MSGHSCVAGFSARLRASSNHLAWIPCHHIARCHITYYNGSRSHDRAVAYAYARPDKGIRAYPCVISDAYLRLQQWSCWIRKIMGPSTNMRTI